MGMDEAGFKRDTFHQAMQDPRFSHVSLKLPTIAAKINSFKPIPGLKIAWMVRDPRDVILSMTQLTGCFSDDKVTCWANHPEGGQAEIESCLQALGREVLKTESFKQLKSISQTPGTKRSYNDAIFLASICWHLKQSLLSLYPQ